MQVTGYTLKRAFNNLIGRMFGHMSCVFCGDRANWKPWMDTINVSESRESFKKIEYELPVCTDCFAKQPLINVLNAVKADIDEYNNFCRSFGAAPAYGDADLELVMSAVEALKSKYGGTQG